MFEIVYFVGGVLATLFGLLAVVSLAYVICAIFGLTATLRRLAFAVEAQAEQRAVEAAKGE